MEFDYKPKLTDENGTPLFEGFIKIKIPKHKERMAFLKKMSLGQDAAGKVIVENKSAGDITDQMFDLFEKNVLAVDLVHKQTGTAFKSLDAMDPYDFYQTLASEVGVYIAKGVQLGNP